MRANSMSGQETMYLEMSMKEDMTLICQVNADMDARVCDSTCAPTRSRKP